MDTPDWQTDVNIAGSDVTLNININAAAVTLNINFLSQSAAVASGSQYGAFQGLSTVNSGAASSTSGAMATCLTYSVPNGKTLYIWGVAAAFIGAGTSTNFLLEIQQGGGIFGIWGDTNGVWFINDQPFVFPAGTLLTFSAAAYGPAGTPQKIITFWGLLV